MASEADWLSQLAWFVMRFQLVADATGSIPRFLGSTLHGAFGYALREVADSNPEVQPLLQYCYPDFIPGSYQPSSPNISRPYVFDVSLAAGGDMQPGREVEAALIAKPQLATHAAFFPALLYSLRRMAERGLGPDQLPFRVRGVCFSPSPRFVPLEERIDIHPELQYSDCFFSAHRRFPLQVTINLASPTQLQAHGKPVEHIAGPELFRRLWDRARAWGNFSHNQSMQRPAFNSIRVVEAQTKWWRAERWSSRQQEQHSISGLVGKVTFEGLDELAWKLLRLGEVIHVGKGTTFGLGKIEILQKQYD